MRIVVTGAFGYVGLTLIGRLAPRHQVVAVGHPPRAAVTVPAGVEIVHGDLSLAARYLDRETAIVHLAGIGGEARCRQDPVAAVRTIVGGTSQLAAAAREAGAPVRLFASSIFVYGTYRQPIRPYREGDSLEADDLYGTCKATAEELWTRHGGGTALRIANVYGAGCGVDLGIAGAIERFARAAAAGGQLTVYGEGTQRIDYVHVDDVGAAIELAIHAAPGTLPPAINVGGGAPVAIGALARACIRAAEAFGARPALVTAPAPEGKIWPDRSLSIELAHRALGWTPRIALEDGVRGMIEMMMRSR